MIFVLMAAHDTSTITASMLAYYLGKHPQWQERARAQSRALGTATLQFDDLATLTVLDAAIKETLRLAAPVGGMIRQVVKDTQILGHHVPAGVMVFASIYNTQRDPGQWPNPDEFDPSRFAEDYREDRSHRYAWAPFGGGAHKCIGMHFGVMEVKAILHKLLLGHRWTIEPGYAPPIGYGTGPTPVDGVPIRFERLP
jgi:cytochrome P450